MSSQPAPQSSLSPMGIDATVDPFSCPQASKVTKDTVKEAIAAQLAAVAALSKKDFFALPGGGGTGAPAASWPQTRCYNCGLGGHKANFCPKIGADFPAVICSCGSGLAVECVSAHADAAAAMCVVCVHKYLCQTATGKRARDAAAAEQQQQPNTRAKIQAAQLKQSPKRDPSVPEEVASSMKRFAISARLDLNGILCKKTWKKYLKQTNLKCAKQYKLRQLTNFACSQTFRNNFLDAAKRTCRKKADDPQLLVNR